MSSSSSKRGLLASPGDGAGVVGERGRQEKEEDRTGCRPSSKCALSKACCCSWGNLEKAWSSSCRRPPSHVEPGNPHLSSRACTPALTAAGPARQDDGRPFHPHPVWQVLSGTSGATRGPHCWADRATRLSALRTLSVSSRSLVRSSLPITPDQTREQRNTHTELPRTLFLISGSTLCQSREFRTLRPITIYFPSYNVQCGIYHTLVLATEGRRHTLSFVSVPHVLVIPLCLVLQHLQPRLGEGSQSANSVGHLVTPPTRVRPDRGLGPHCCSRWFGMSGENRLVLDSVAQIPKEPGVKRPPPPATHPQPKCSRTGTSQSNGSDVRLYNLMHDAYTRY